MTGLDVHVEVYGCATTQAEGATLKALVERAGHRLVEPDERERGADGVPRRADAAILVTCTVVERTERNMVDRLQALAAAVPVVVVTGCMAAAQPERVLDACPHALILAPTELDQVVPLLEEGRFTPAPVDKAGLPRVVEGGVATIVINDGCLARCSFCITKLARPGLRSYPIESIVDAVRDAAQRGAVEVRLTSMDTGAYGRDLGLEMGIVGLLRAVADVDGAHRIRLGMLNPFLGLPYLDELLDVLAHDRFYRFLHVPVQSGSDAVLDHMGRQHTAADLERIAARAREALGEVTLATDVICGYPTETPEDHRATVDLLERVRPGVVNVTRFSPRPGTRAAELAPLNGRLVKERSRELSRVRDRLQREHRGRFRGRTVEATVVEHIQAGTCQARTADYTPVVLGHRLPIGTRCWVRVTGATVAHATARPVAGPSRTGLIQDAS